MSKYDGGWRLFSQHKIREKRSICRLRVWFCDLLTFPNGCSAEGSRSVGLGDFSYIRAGIHPGIDVRDSKAVPVMLVLVVMPSMLSPDAFVEIPLRAIPTVCEVMGPLVEHG